MKNQHSILKNFVEGELNFAPTYKYDVGTTDFDTSKKKRTPSYTDRILMCRSNDLTDNLIEDKFEGDNLRAGAPTYYNRRESTFSDHRPVLATY